MVGLPRILMPMEIGGKVSREKVVHNGMAKILDCFAAQILGIADRLRLLNNDMPEDEYCEAFVSEMMKANFLTDIINGKLDAINAESLVGLSKETLKRIQKNTAEDANARLDEIFKAAEGMFS